MKRIVFLLVLIVICAALFGQTLNGVMFSNNTGYEISELYVSPSSHDDWYENLLVEGSVEDGGSIYISIPDQGDGDLIFDAMALDADGDSYSKFEIDLSNPNSRTIEITFDDYDDEYEDGEESYDGDYDTGYNDGYQDGYKDAFRDAYKEGYAAGIEDSGDL